MEIDEIQDELYSFQKVLLIRKNLEIEIFINPKRKQKQWNLFYKSIGHCLLVIRERYDDKSLQVNQVLLTDEYDDQSSEEEIKGYDIEARKLAEENAKKDKIASLLGKLVK